ncbi:MAG: sugar-binding domain-containing protein [Candidatus Limnocylindrales bacterium]
MRATSREPLGRWSLAGTWDLAPTGGGPVRRVVVPACWEDSGVPVDLPGPFTYRRRVRIPSRPQGSRLWLRFDGVSHACRVLVDGHEVGAHIGAWDRFELEITRAVGLARSILLEVEVEKPASLTAGPESPAVPGRFPMRETLAGFLPYVWGHMFGGIWQDVSLVVTGQVMIEQAHVTGDADGWVTIDATLSAPSQLAVAVRGPDGDLVEHIRAEPAADHRLRLLVPAPRVWSPEHPDLYTVELRVPAGDERTVTFGLRSVGSDGTLITLNGRPIFPRMILSWGWYPERLTPAPEPARVRADLEQLRRLGFNGVKLCLWVPPESYLDVCDELGMLVWLELPMWLPHPSPTFRTQVGPEYERIVRTARQHPSVVMYSIGCELNSDVADLLGPLYELVKGLAGDALVRDNSGSGEAYGGSLDEAADFHDHHPYAELHHLPELLDHFAPRWRRRQPWVFGEFADSDAFRDPRAQADARGRLPWWTSPDASRNPQGARWAMEVTGFAEALQQAGSGTRADELRRISDQASLLLRRRVFETVRARDDVSGYVLTGERDTPISTSGVWDDTGRVRLDEDALRRSNADLVLALGWDRRRAWVAGGDRPARSDPWTHPSGQAFRTYLVLSHFGSARAPVEVEWAVHREGGREMARGSARSAGEMRPGEVREVAVVAFDLPDVLVPTALRLEATATIGDDTASNDWPLWVFPATAWPTGGAIAVLDPDGSLEDLRQLLGRVDEEPAHPRLAVASRWTEAARAHVERGGRLVLLQGGPDGPLPVTPLPFWREAIRIAEPHVAWGDFPVAPFLGLQVAAVAADHAFVPGPSDVQRPIMRRVDARTGAHHDYVVEVTHGRGSMIATTLRLAGGVGDLPGGLTRSPGALHQLACWLRYLAT